MRRTTSAHLYELFCWSVRPLVGWSVRWSVTHERFSQYLLYYLSDWNQNWCVGRHRWGLEFGTRSRSLGQRSRSNSWFGENFVLAVDHEPFVGLNSNLVYMLTMILSMFCIKVKVIRLRVKVKLARSHQRAFLVITNVLLVGLKPNLVWGLTLMKATN